MTKFTMTADISLLENGEIETGEFRLTINYRGAGDYSLKTVEARTFIRGRNPYQDGYWELAGPDEVRAADSWVDDVVNDPLIEQAWIEHCEYERELYAELKRDERRDEGIAP